MLISATPHRPSPAERELEALVERMKRLPANSRERPKLITRIRELEDRIDAESGM